MVKVFVEGGGVSSSGKIRCQNAFNSLFQKCNLKVNIVAKGSRNEVFKWFRNTLKQQKDERFLAMLIDSEDSVENTDKTWLHLQRRDRWTKPDKASDDQVLFMTTCQETWVYADLHMKRGIKLQPDIEKYNRDNIRTQLEKITDGKYDKAHGKQFKFVAEIEPNNLTALPSFTRTCRILTEKLNKDSK